MTGDDKIYYLSRAESELQLAEDAAHQKAAWAHFQLAGRYFDLAYRSVATESEDGVSIDPGLGPSLAQTM